MTPTTKPWTYDELIAQGLDPKDYEILDGELVRVKNVSAEGGRLLVVLSSLLHEHASRNRLGAVYAVTRFLLRKEPRRERRPDIAFLRKERIPAGNPRILQLAPDLVIEILSPTDPALQSQEKVRADLEDGVAEAWIVDPFVWTITVLKPDRVPRPYGVGDTLETPLLPGFGLSLEKLFAPLAQA